MRAYLLLSLAGLLSVVMGRAQFTDRFTDGDFSSNPAWSGSSVADWQVNAALQLQSNNVVANSTFYLSTASTKALSAQWDFYTQITFNPSSANYIDVYLTASSGDISLAGTTGYFVRIGNTSDEISLYRKDAAGVITELIDGADAVLNTSNNSMRIRVTRNAANQWTLSRDLTGTGNSYFTEGTATDATYTSSAFFGILVKQSTVASFAQRHFFDDIEVQDYVPDILPPVVVAATAISTNTLDVLFNEPVDLASSQLVSNYTASNGLGSPVSATRDAVNTALVHLGFAGSFPNRVNLTLTVSGVKDLNNNTLLNGTASFSYFTAAQYDIVIDEIMADPTPLVGLPDAEWIELKNTTAFDINLQGWRVGKPGSQSGPMASYILRPDSFVIVSATGAAAALAGFGPVLPVTSFPALSNGGDLLYLRSSQGLIVHAVNYHDSWYQNELKKEGGWSLEMTDTRNPCSGRSNWKASVDPRGGTPAKKNSTDGINADQVLPKLIRAYATDSITVTLVFNEPMDSVRASIAASYVISDGTGSPLSATPVSPLFDRVVLKLSGAQALLRNKMYTVTVSALTDCGNNSIGSNNVARVGLYEQLDSFDLVINEVLFNPKPQAVDYVELYNRSNKIINLRNAYIANRSSSGVISSIFQLSTEDYLLFPGDFIVLTEDADVTRSNYVTQQPEAFIQLSSLPSYSDDKGTVIVLNEQGRIVDEVTYLDDWHFALLSNDEGVSLERIDYNASSQDASNWHSAASSIGYGTPTYKNSQFRIDAGVQADITVSPGVMSPDNDGIDDFATISYHFPDPGYVANITIFDAVGRPVRYLQRNALNGTRGYYRWDGLGEKNAKLPVGIYIIYTEVFNLQGKTKRFKHTVVLARRL